MEHAVFNGSSVLISGSFEYYTLLPAWKRHALLSAPSAGGTWFCLSEAPRGDLNSPGDKTEWKWRLKSLLTVLLHTDEHKPSPPLSSSFPTSAQTLGLTEDVVLGGMFLIDKFPLKLPSVVKGKKVNFTSTLNRILVCFREDCVALW